MRGLLWVAACLLVAVSARAQGDTVRVQIAACAAGAPGWDTQQMLEIVRVEIAPRQLVLADGEQGSLHIDACDPSRLLLRDLTRSEPQVREMPLDDVPAQLKPRVAALAVAELAVGAPVDALPPPKPPAAVPAPAPRHRQRVRLDSELLSKDTLPQRTETWLGLGAEGRVFFFVPGPNFGPRLTLALPYVQLGIVSLLGRQTVAAGGDVSTGIAAGALDVPFWRPKRAPDVSIAAGFEAGVTWAQGKLRNPDSDQARSAHAKFFAALVRLNWGGRVARTAYAQVAWALGYAQGLNARAYNRDAATTHGPFAAMTATIAWVP